MSKKEAKYPRDVLDSVLSDNGTMPAAHLWIRFQAFVLDWVFISLLASLIIWRFLMPQEHPDAYTELNEWVEDVAKSLGNNGLLAWDTIPPWNESLKAAISDAQIFMTLAFWIYFAIGEAFFVGRTFGKAIFRLRTISVITMEKPFFVSAILRAGIKTLCLAFPLLLVVTMILFRFNRRRQMGYDLLCRTAVIDERYLPAPNIPAT